MVNERFVTVDDVIKIFNISKSKAYKIMQQLNHELEMKGKIIIRGKVPKRYLEERMYL